MKISILLLLSILMVSCGKDSAIFPTNKVVVQKVAPAVEEEFSYELKQGSCSTGKHTSDSFFDICDKLIDHKLNKNCAEDKRKSLFESASCVGNFS